MTDWTPPNIKVQKSSLDFWNTYLRDNMEHIKAPPNSQYAPAYANSFLSTASTSFVDISSDYSLTIETFGGDLLISLSGNAENAYFDIAINGSRLGGVDGIQKVRANRASLNINWIHQGLAPGTHTISAQWKDIGGGSRIYRNFMPIFNVREFS
jgi:hypothetical protein